jgi:hypothetical protein
MPHVALVAPHFLENTNRYVRAFAQLDGVTLSLISEDPERVLRLNLRERVAGHYQVRSVSDPRQLALAIAALSKGAGPVDSTEREVGAGLTHPAPRTRQQRQSERAASPVAPCRRRLPKGVLEESN